MAARAEIKGTAKLDASGWEAGLSRMKQGASSFAASAIGRFTAVTAVIAAISKVVSFVGESMKEAASLDRTAKILGMSSGKVEGIRDMVEATGASGEGFQQKMAKMVDSQEEAVKGNKQMIDSFMRLGVSISELSTLSPEQLLLRVAQGAQTSGTAVSDLNNIMGKGAAAEYYSALRDIAEKGMPGINKAMTESITHLSLANRSWTVLKDKVSDFFKMAIYYSARGNIINLALGDPLGKKVNAQIAQDESDRKKLEAMRKAGLAAEEEAQAVKRQAKETELRLKYTEKLTALGEKNAKAIGGITVGQAQGDSLARIGGFQGGQLNPMIGAMERTAKATEINAEFAKEQAELTKEMNQKLKEMAGE
jgi:hypothetical protein